MATKPKPVVAEYCLIDPKGLIPAPRIFKIGEEIDPKTMPIPANAWIRRKGWLGEYEMPFEEIPESKGRVTLVCQLTKTGSGFIKVRWGEILEPGSILVEYHFRGNPALQDQQDVTRDFGKLRPPKDSRKIN